MSKADAMSTHAQVEEPEPLELPPFNLPPAQLHLTAVPNPPVGHRRHSVPVHVLADEIAWAHGCPGGGGVLTVP